MSTKGYTRTVVMVIALLFLTKGACVIPLYLIMRFSETKETLQSDIISISSLLISCTKYAI